MILKSALRATIDEVLEEHEVEDTALATDLLDRLVLDFGEEVYDNEDEETEPDFLGNSKDG